MHSKKTIKAIEVEQDVIHQWLIMQHNRAVKAYPRDSEMARYAHYLVSKYRVMIKQSRGEALNEVDTMLAAQFNSDAKK